MKLLSIDLDGTLFNTEGKPTEDNMKAVLAAIKNGHQVIINSGRPLEAIIKYTELTNLHVPIICHNGSQIYNEKLELLYEKAIPFEEAKNAIIIANKLGLRTQIESKQGNFKGVELLTSKEKLDVFKVVFQAEEEKNSLYEMKRLLDSNVFSFALQVHKNKMEATSAMNSKGLAIKLYQKLTKNKYEEIFVIGDGENDIEHFKVASLSVAMDNAEEHVKQKADFVTKLNNEDGVAYAIKNIFKLIN